MYEKVEKYVMGDNKSKINLENNIPIISINVAPGRKGGGGGGRGRI